MNKLFKSFRIFMGKIELKVFFFSKKFNPVWKPQLKNSLNIWQMERSIFNQFHEISKNIYSENSNAIRCGWLCCLVTNISAFSKISSVENGICILFVFGEYNSLDGHFSYRNSIYFFCFHPIKRKLEEREKERESKIRKSKFRRNAEKSWNKSIFHF